MGTPIYDKKDYCRERFVENIKKLDYPADKLQWCLVDNSQRPAYYHKLRRLYPGHAWRVKRGSNTRDALRNAMNFLRLKAIEEDYDYLLIVESDLFPEPDALKKLLRHHKDVVGLPYEIGFNKNRGLCVFTLDKKTIGMGTRRLTPEESKTFLDGSLKKVHGMGVGCCLIKREILEEFPFWYSAADNDRMKGMTIRKHPDVYFYLDLHNKGRRVFLDTSTLVYHENSDWGLVKDT